MAALTTKVDMDTAAKFTAWAEHNGETVSSLLREWVLTAVAGGAIALVDSDTDEHRGYVLLRTTVATPR